MPTALVQGRIASPYADMLRNFLSDNWEVLVWDPEKNNVDEFVPMALRADAVIGGTIPLAKWPTTPNLKLFQIPWTGYDFCSPETMPAGIPVANCFEHESAIAEYVLAGMLETRIGLRQMDAKFRAKGWDGRMPGAGVYHGEVRNNTVGIIGYGHIGEEVAKRAKAFDMRVIGVRRSAQETPEFMDWLGTSERMDELLSESDFIIVTCDLNSETEGMINKAMFEKMKASATIINVARGRVINEQDLFDALKNKKIGGAVLDVWYNYLSADNMDAWPSNLPFHELDNVILSAHESALSDQMMARRWEFVAKNLERIISGQEPENIVFTGVQDNTSNK